MDSVAQEFDLDLTELNKLEEMLKDHGIKYRREDFKSKYYEHHEIFYPSKTRHIADAIISTASYGREKGLLEQMGLLPVRAKDSVEGFLTAEQVFERIKKYNDGINKREV